MIVKNESHIIQQTLSHLLGIFPITYWVIDDTGSTDGTQDLIRQFFGERGISGELYETSWRNFGWNRTQAFQHAYDKTDYVLVWDADDSVVGTLRLPEPMTADSYKVTFGNKEGFRYGRTQIFNNRRRWRYVGVLHEYPALAEGDSAPVKEVVISGDYYCESGRSGARNRDPQKYLRDAETLERGLLEEPSNDRYVFYCANSYKDAGLPEKAIEKYKQLLSMKTGWVEEKYLACVRIWDLSQCEANIPYLIKSHNYVPDRVEGIHRLIEYYCINNQDRIALGFYRFIQDYYEKKYLSDRSTLSRHLFVTQSTYDYDLPYYVIISALRSPEKDPALVLRMFDMIFRCGYTRVTPFRSNSLFFNLQFALSSLTPSLEFLQNLLVYRDSLPHQLESRSEEVVQKVVDLHQPLLASPMSNTLPRMIIRETTDIRILCTITTCKRLDLFRQTMNSLLRCWKDFDRITEFLIVDDNSSAADRSAMEAEFPFLTFYWKTPAEIGHRTSMNIIWSHLHRTRPDYWIHLEDDWLFYRERSYVTDAIEFLDRHQTEKIHQVLFNRNYAELQTGWGINGGIPLEKGFLLHEKSDTIPGRNCGYWPHYSFRPSVIRTSAILELGNYDSANQFFERDYADRWFTAGFRSAFFNTITCKHIGKLTSDRSGQNAYTLNGQDQFNSVTTTTTATTTTNSLSKNKTFIVNLARRPDRKAEVIATMSAADISESDYTIYTAVDGMSLTVTPELQYLFTGNDFGSRRGVIGCALSHYRLWQQFVREHESVKTYTVFEDDITLVPNFKTLWASCLQELNQQLESIDLLLLGRHIFSEHKKERPIRILPLDKPGCAGGTFGYILTRNGAQKLLAYISANGICHGIDYLMKIQPDSTFNTKMVEPPIVLSEWVRTTTSTVDSDIQKDTNALNLRDGGDWIFYQGLDHTGSDIHFVKGLSIPNLECVANNYSGCNAFNSLGFLKSTNEITLKSSVWFNKRDGVWVKRQFLQKPKRTRVKILCNWCSPQAVLKQFSKFTKGNNIWNNLEITCEDTNIDYWVIINKPQPNCGYYDPSRTIIFHMEPWCGDSNQTWGVKTWGEWARPDPSKFLYVGSHERDINMGFWQLSYNYNDLVSRPFPKMDEPIISSICSSKYFDPGHIKRINFLKYIEAQSDPCVQIHIYNMDNKHGFKSYKGRADPDIDKEKGIAPYKYYFMCENNVEKNFITEKLWEPILTETLCFYWGCPNVADWIDSRAFVQLDMDDFAGSFALIKRAIQENWWLQRLPYMRAEKKKIMGSYTLMPRVEHILNDYYSNTLPSPSSSSPVCFIHSCNVNNRAYNLLQKFLDLLSVANQKFSFILINNTGVPLQQEKLKIPPTLSVIIRESSQDTQLFEADTLRIVSSYCKQHPTAKILYLHTKGVSYEPSSPLGGNVKDWIDYMLFASLSDVSACISLLDTYDTIGVNMSNTPHLHYSGNFWWSTAAHITNLPTYTLTDKMSAEWWILQKEGGNYLNLYSSNINHFKSPYPLNMYRLNVMRSLFDYSNNSLQILYGKDNTYIDVTQRVCDQAPVVIPASDLERTTLCGCDPVPGVVKEILIFSKNSEDYIVTVGNIASIKKDISGVCYIDNFLNPEKKLTEIHNTLICRHGKLTDEYPEQIMAALFIKPTDKVLEIGGNIGRNTMVISRLLNDSLQLVTLESDPVSSEKLIENRTLNNLNFNIINAALSSRKLLQKDWITRILQHDEDISDGWKQINTIEWADIKREYGEFNVLVADCEGALYYILQDFPDFIQQFNTIIVENDYCNIAHKEAVDSQFRTAGLTPVYWREGGWGPCFRRFYEVWQRVI